MKKNVLMIVAGVVLVGVVVGGLFWFLTRQDVGEIDYSSGNLQGLTVRYVNEGRVIEWGVTRAAVSLRTSEGEEQTENMVFLTAEQLERVMEVLRRYQICQWNRRGRASGDRSMFVQLVTNAGQKIEINVGAEVLVGEFEEFRVEIMELLEEIYLQQQPIVV